jgi:GlcNAc-P-P-Und epimerase
MRILITGGSGFVGARLASRLKADGHTVSVFDTRPSEVCPDTSIVGDLRNPGDCRRAVQGQELVFHLAALYRDDVRPRELYQQVNVDGTRNLANAAAESDVRNIIFTSSFSVYGLDDAGKSEEGAMAPVNEYGRTKMEGERILLDWQAAGDGRRIVMVRPSVIFGEGNRGNVWTLLNEIHHGRFVMIGAGRNRKSMAYVGNMAEFLRFLITAEVGPVAVFNYADKPDMDVNQIVTVAASALGRSLRRLPLPGSVAMLMGYAGDLAGLLARRVLTLNSERIRKFLADTSLPTDRVKATGFVAPYDLREAFVQTIRSEFPTPPAG